MKRRFVRILGSKETLTLAFGAMIGWGWVVLAGDWVVKGGVLGALTGFAVAGFGIGIIALLYGELASAMPQVGGEHVYSLRALGPAGSFICTWAIIFGYVSVTAFEAVALPTVFEYLIPDIKHIYLWQISGYEVYLSWVLIGVSGALVITGLNILGVKPSGVFQASVTVVVVIAGCMLFAGALGKGTVNNIEPAFNGITGITAVMVMAPFMLVGFDVIPQAAEEIDLPFKTIGLLIVVSVLLATLWYCLIILSTATLLNHSELIGSSLAAADASTKAWGSWGGEILVLGGIAGIITSWNGFVVGGSRAVYALAEGGMLPAFLARLHPRYKTPANAIILVGLISCLAPLFGREILVVIVNAGGFGIVVAYLLVAVSFLRLRTKEPTLPRPFKLPGGKLFGWLGVLIAAGLCLLYLPGSPSALGGQEWLMVTCWCVLGVFMAGPRLLRNRGE